MTRRQTHRLIWVEILVVSVVLFACVRSRGGCGDAERAKPFAGEVAR